MGKPHLLLAESSNLFREELARKLAPFFHVFPADNGIQALTLLRQHQPELALIDLMLPQMDGLSVLRQVRKEGLPLLVLATTRFVSQYVADMLEELGVSYFMSKPCDPDAVVAHLRELGDRLPTPQRPPNQFDAVSTLLLQMGFSPRLKGFSFLLEAIFLFAQEPGQAITKELYPAVARRSHATISQVECDIRAAIQSAFHHSDASLWRLYFPNETAPPSNAVFLCRIVSALRGFVNFS